MSRSGAVNTLAVRPDAQKCRIECAGSTLAYLLTDILLATIKRGGGCNDRATQYRHLRPGYAELRIFAAVCGFEHGVASSTKPQFSASFGSLTSRRIRRGHARGASRNLAQQWHRLLPITSANALPRSVTRAS